MDGVPLFLFRWFICHVYATEAKGEYQQEEEELDDVEEEE